MRNKTIVDNNLLAKVNMPLCEYQKYFLDLFWEIDNFMMIYEQS